MIVAKNIIGKWMKDGKEAMVTKASMLDVPASPFSLGSSAIMVFKKIEQMMELKRLIPVKSSTCEQ